jgi:hypothetical protein
VGVGPAPDSKQRSRVALSDHPSRQGKSSKVHHTLVDTANGKQAWWSDKQKLEAVQSYLLFGSVATTARVLKIPEQTMRNWKNTSWWKEIEGELKVQDEMQLSARLKKVMEKSLDAVDDRLDNGDFVFDQKTGSMQRKPVNMRDAHKVSMDLIDKRALLLNRNKPEASEEQMSDKLLKMMKQFADFATGKLEENKTIDVEDVEIKEETNGLSGNSLSRDADGVEDKTDMSNLSN